MAALTSSRLTTLAAGKLRPGGSRPGFDKKEDLRSQKFRGR